MRSATGWMIAVLASPLLVGCPQLEGNKYSQTNPADAADPVVDAGVPADASLETPVTVSVDDDWIVAVSGHCEQDKNWQNVVWVADGDTIELDNGKRVRFLMIDTPELSSKDCQAQAALAYSAAQLPASSSVCLEYDNEAGDEDMYDRLLRYVWYRREGKVVQLNARLLRMGHAQVFYPFAKGLKYEKDGKDMEARARKEKLGGWGACGW